MVFTRRIKILSFIANFRIISTPQIAHLLHLKPRSARRVTGDLIKTGLLDVLPRPYSGSKGRPENLYVISPKGVEILRDEGILAPKIPLNRVLWEARQSIEHQLAANWFLVAAEKMKEVTDLDVEYISQTSPFTPVGENGKGFLVEEFNEENGSITHVVPDAVLSIQNPANRKASLFYVEIDRSTESLSGCVSKKNTIRSKIVNYKKLFCIGQYKRFEEYFDATYEGFRVLFICDTIKRCSKIMSILEEQNPSNFIWLSTLNQILEKGLGANIWQFSGNTVYEQSSILGPQFAIVSPVIKVDKNETVT